VNVLKVEANRERHVDNRGGDLVVLIGRRWIRFAAYYGTPPGSRIGLWRTRAYGLYGLNLRVGKRITGPCLTTFVHTKRRDPLR
jgi:hypothetical protein